MKIAKNKNSKLYWIEQKEKCGKNKFYTRYACYHKKSKKKKIEKIFIKWINFCSTLFLSTLWFSIPLFHNFYIEFFVASIKFHINFWFVWCRIQKSTSVNTWLHGKKSVLYNTKAYIIFFRLLLLLLLWLS